MRVALAIVPLVALVGCFGDGPTLYLEYTLMNLGSEDREASPGPHCGTARVEGDQATVERDAYRSIGSRRPFLIVEPDLGDSPTGYYFFTTGTEGYPMALPAEIHPNIGADDVIIARIDEQGGEITVDGQVVALPHAWAREATGNWRAEFRLTAGPSRVELFTMHGCA